MAPPVLALRDVRLADGSRSLFDGVDLPLEARARAALVGRNGAGKSTLLRLLAGANGARQRRAHGHAGPAHRLCAAGARHRRRHPARLRHGRRGGAARGGGGAGGVRSRGRPLHGGPLRRRDAPRRPGAGLRRRPRRPAARRADQPSRHPGHRDPGGAAGAQSRGHADRQPRPGLSGSRDHAVLLAGEPPAAPDGRPVQRLSTPGRKRSSPWRRRPTAGLQKSIEREHEWMLYGVTARRARNEGRRRRLVALRAEKADRLRLARGEAQRWPPRAPARPASGCWRPRGCPRPTAGRA